mgnify:CR=1 FL=1
MRNNVTVTTMKIGMNLKPDFALPLLIMDIIIAEKNEDIIRETIAKIMKSL